MKLEKGLGLIVNCVYCNQQINLNSNEQTEVKQRSFKDGNEELKLTYFTCPCCGIEHYVQIDNKETKDKLKSVVFLMKKVSSLKKNGKVIPKDIQKSFEEKRKLLNKARETLMQKYQGKEFLDETGKKIKINFVRV